MTAEQKKAAKKLHKALKNCRAVGLGVYLYDGTVGVCPQPEGREHEGWNHSPMDVVSELGTQLYVNDLDADGGAGR